MKERLSDLAILGGEKTFLEKCPLGQVNLPEWARVKKTFSGIFERHYFSNHGLLAQDLEIKLGDFFNVKNAVTITNETIALMHTIVAKNLRDKNVIVPALTHPSTVQALYWTGVNPIFCDVDPKTYLITPELASPLIRKYNASGIIAVHLWNNICDTTGFDYISKEFSIPVIYDASHAFGCKNHDQNVGASGASEIFSLKSNFIVNGAEGGIVCTNDDEIATAVRNLRSSYGRRRVVSIPLQANGRFSEFQAGLALLSFEDFGRNRLLNKDRLLAYNDELKNLEGIKIQLPENPDTHNCQHVVTLIDEKDFGLSRDLLCKILSAENISLDNNYAKGMHKLPPAISDGLSMREFPITDSITLNVLLLPSGQKILIDDVKKICQLLAFIRENATAISSKINLH